MLKKIFTVPPEGRMVGGGLLGRQTFLVNKIIR